MCIQHYIYWRCGCFHSFDARFISCQYMITYVKICRNQRFSDSSTGELSYNQKKCEEIRTVERVTKPENDNCEDCTRKTAILLARKDIYQKRITKAEGRAKEQFAQFAPNLLQLMESQNIADPNASRSENRKLAASYAEWRGACKNLEAIEDEECRVALHQNQYPVLTPLLQETRKSSGESSSSAQDKKTLVETGINLGVFKLPKMYADWPGISHNEVDGDENSTE